jgi:hypothetical protein
MSESKRTKLNKYWRNSKNQMKNVKKLPSSWNGTVIFAETAACEILGAKWVEISRITILSSKKM